MLAAAVTRYCISSKYGSNNDSCRKQRHRLEDLEPCSRVLRSGLVKSLCQDRESGSVGVELVAPNNCRSRGGEGSYMRQQLSLVNYTTVLPLLLAPQNELLPFADF